MSTEIATKHNDLKTDLIPKDWDIFDIQTVSTVVGGGTPSTTNEKNFNGSIPWITPRDLSAHLDRYISHGERSITEEGLNSSNAKLLPVYSVLLTTRAPVGYLAIASNEVTTNQGFHSLIPNEKTNSLFLFYLLKNNIQTLVDNASGSTFQELNGKTLKSLEFAFPKIKEQEKIAEILSSIDDKIELNRKINFNLEKLGSFLFKEWFIDVDNQQIGKVSDLIRVESGFPFHSSMFDENGDYKLVTIKMSKMVFLSQNAQTLLVKYLQRCRLIAD
jgi:type I restriction enzyme S subunit